MNSSRTAALVVGALLLAPLGALAEDKVQVVVVPYAPLYDSIPRATGERIAETLEGELKTVGAEVVARPGEAAAVVAAPSSAASDEQKAAVEAAVADVEKGKSLLARRKVKPALDALERAIEAMEGNAPAMMNVAPLVQAHLKRGVALFLMGKEDVARTEAIPAAIRLDPSLRISAGPEYAQVYVDLVEKVRAKLFAEPFGSLRVDTTPPGAGVWVDDRESSTSPALAKGLIPGTHYVRIKPPGADFYVQTIEIKPGQMARISPDAGAVKEGMIAGLVSHLSKNQLGKDSAKQLKAVAQKAGAPYVVIGGAFAQGANMGIVTFVYAAKKDALIELSRITLDREMLGATIEINKLANEIAAKVPAFAGPVTLPRALASDAKAGEELVNEVDFTPAAPAKDEKPGAIVPIPAKAVEPANGGGRRPVTRTPVTGGGQRPEDAAPLSEPLGAAEPAPAPAAEPAAPVAKGPVVARAPATSVDDSGMVFKAKAPAPAPAAEPAPADDFKLDFEESLDEPVAKKDEEQKPNYKYLGGSSIEDEVVVDPEQLGKKPEGGLLSKWWFWAGAAVVAGGAATAAFAAGGEDATGATASVSLKR